METNQNPVQEQSVQYITPENTQAEQQPVPSPEQPTGQLAPKPEPQPEQPTEKLYNPRRSRPDRPKPDGRLFQPRIYSAFREIGRRYTP